MCWLGVSVSAAAQSQSDVADTDSVLLLLDRVAELEREVKELQEIADVRQTAGESPATEPAQTDGRGHDHGDDFRGASASESVTARRKSPN